MQRSAIENPKSKIENAKILIVDDNVNLCKTMALILGRKGYAVTPANDGPDSIEKARERSFDIILMDIKMPGMDGVETYRRIKRIRPEPVVIMMTAYRQEMADLMEEALSENAYTCLYKPLDMEELLRLVDEILERKRERR